MPLLIRSMPDRRRRATLAGLLEGEILAHIDPVAVAVAIERSLGERLAAATLTAARAGS